MLAFPKTAVAGYFFLHSDAMRDDSHCDSAAIAARKRGGATRRPSLFWRFMF